MTLPDHRARYEALRERDNLRSAQLSEAFEEAEKSCDYYAADELAADLREQAESDLHEALDVLRELLEVEK